MLVGTSASALTGNSLNNTITGNNQANTINGKLGNDILTGGFGADTFVLANTPSATNRDTITNFNPVNDHIHLDNAIFTAHGAAGALSAAAFFQGAAAHDASDRIIYNSANGALIYDSNGNAAGGAIQIATLDTGPTLTAEDFGVI